MSRSIRNIFCGVALLLSPLLLVGACRSVGAPEVPDPNVQVTDERITITDRMGKVWDITHAVKRYGFDPGGFEFGVGQNTIPPVFNPEFVGPGEQGFPSAGANFMVLGTQFAADARAYVIPALSLHEVVNDRFGSKHVAVAY